MLFISFLLFCICLFNFVKIFIIEKIIFFNNLMYFDWNMIRIIENNNYNILKNNNNNNWWIDIANYFDFNNFKFILILFYFIVF